MDKNNSYSGKNKEISIDEALENLNSKMEETKMLNISENDNKLFDNYINKDKISVDDNYVDYFAKVISEDTKRAETELRKIKESEKTKDREKTEPKEKTVKEEEYKPEVPEYIDYFKQESEEDERNPEEKFESDETFTEDTDYIERFLKEEDDEETEEFEDYFSEADEEDSEKLSDENKKEHTIRLVHSSTKSKQQKKSSTGKIKIVDSLSEKEENTALKEEFSEDEEEFNKEDESYSDDGFSENFSEIFEDDEDDEYSKYYDLDYDDEDDDSNDKRSKIIPIAVILLCLIGAVAICFTNSTVNYGLRNMAASFIGSIGFNVPQSLKTTNDMVEVDGSESVEDIVYRTEVKSSVTIPIENAEDSVFDLYSTGVVYAYANRLVYINGRGETEWDCETSIVNPIIYTEGSYVVVAEKNGNRICLYKNGKLVYDIPTDDSIQSVKVSANGDVITITNRVSYKGGIAVYNNDGNLVYSWSSGSDSVVSADISSSSRRVAVSLLNSDSIPYSTVSMFNIKKEKSYSNIKFDNTIIFDLEFLGDDLNAMGDNSMIGMSSGGKVFYDKRFDDVELLRCSMDSFGNKLMLFESGNVPMMNIYNDNGSLENTIYARDLPTHISIYKNRVLYSFGRNVILTSADIKKQYMYTASMDIKDIFLLNKSTFLLKYSNGVEIVRM